jgi:hypothetical protein
MIIVEGPDGSGKSTLISRLGHQRVHLRSLRGGVGGTTPEGWGGGRPVVDAYVHALDTHPPETAFDRFHLSELVYGPILRNTQLITPEILDALTNEINRRRIPVIVCLPSWETTYRNVTQPGRERPGYQTDDFLRASYDAWHAVAWTRLWNRHWFRVWDYMKDPLPPLSYPVVS